MYEYKATIQTIHDGDTIKVWLDQGLREFRVMSIRFYGINAPELWTTEGKLARAALVQYLTDEFGNYKPLVIRTIQDQADKYGERWEGKVWRESDGEWGDDNQFVTTARSANEWMIDSGHAVPYNPNDPR